LDGFNYRPAAVVPPNTASDTSDGADFFIDKTKENGHRVGGRLVLVMLAGFSPDS